MKGLSLEEKLEEYKDEQHLTSMARYLGRWQAMAVSSGEFCGHLDQPLRDLRDTLTLNPTPEEGQRNLAVLAPRLAHVSMKIQAKLTEVGNQRIGDQVELPLDAEC